MEMIFYEEAFVTLTIDTDVNCYLIMNKHIQIKGNFLDTQKEEWEYYTLFPELNIAVDGNFSDTKKKCFNIINNKYPDKYGLMLIKCIEKAILRAKELLINNN